MEEKMNDKEEFLEEVEKRFPVPSVIPLDIVSEELLNDSEVVLLLINRDQGLINKIFSRENLRNNTSLVRSLAEDSIFGTELMARFSDELRNDKNFMLNIATSYNYQYDSFVGDELKNDEEFNKVFQKIKSTADWDKKADIYDNFRSKEVEKELSKMHITQKVEFLGKNPDYINNMKEFKSLENISGLRDLFSRKDMSFLKKADTDVQFNFIVMYPDIAEDIGLMTEEIKYKISKNNMIDKIGKELHDEAFGYDLTMGYMRKIVLNGDDKLFNKSVKILYENNNLSRSERLSGLNKLLKSYTSLEYQDLLKNVNLENVDIDKLNNVLSQPNYFNLKTQEDLNNYDSIKLNVCDAIINGDTEILKKYPEIDKIDKKNLIKFATLQKLFGFDLGDAEKIRDKFWSIDEIKLEDSNGLKKYVQTIQKIYDESDDKKLSSVYKFEPVNLITQNKEEFNQKIKELYLNEFNNSLFDINSANIIDNDSIKKYIDNPNIDKVNFLDAGTEFNMIIHSVGAFSNREGIREIKNNCAADWNQRINKNNQEFSCSYIGNDMLGTADITALCYGFDEISEKSLEMSSYSDLATNENNNEELNMIKSKNAKSNMFFPPQGLKDNTDEYNELLFSRIQDGKRKQPSYVVLFKKNGEINKQLANNAIKAVNDFKQEGLDIPVVIVDVDKCIESEKVKINNMLLEAKQTGDLNKYEQAKNKLHNNRVANKLEFKEYGPLVEETYQAIASKKESKLIRIRNV